MATAHPHRILDHNPAKVSAKAQPAVSSTEVSDDVTAVKDATLNKNNPAISTGKLKMAVPQLGAKPKPDVPTDTAPPPLGPLENFSGTFQGNGLNQIFRPKPGSSGDNILELNLFTETLDFAEPLGDVPNRGLLTQDDIHLNGVPYLQKIFDVTNVTTGKADGNPVPIHFEPGLWMHVPATQTPKLGTTLARMGSIPHGATINAQSLTAHTTTNGPPTIPKQPITPFVADNPSQLIPFPSQTASNADTDRLPKDLSACIKAGTITQSILDDPNTVLRDAIKGQKISKTITFTVSTTPTTAGLGGGADNIAFLEGASTGGHGPNAHVADMKATFWIETVENEIEVPVFKKGDAPLHIKATGANGPTFLVQPPRDITKPTKITVPSTQIQYSQIVLLDFATLSWPHVSVATLVPQAEITVPDSAFN